MTMTRTRRKQKQEMVRRAVHEADERESNLRQKFLLRATAIVQQAAYEPALFHHQTQQVPSDNAGEGSFFNVLKTRFIFRIIYWLMFRAPLLGKFGRTAHIKVF